jgi:transcriptional regulator with XRE-family HTH domain
LPKLPLSALGRLVREKRGPRKLREVAKEIGISAPTLMRIEAGRIPDVETFGRVCLWLAIDPGDFLGSPSHEVTDRSTIQQPALRVSAHFKADRLPLAETAAALAKMLVFVAQWQATGAFRLDNGDA